MGKAEIKLRGSLHLAKYCHTHSLGYNNQGYLLNNIPQALSLSGTGGDGADYCFRNINHPDKS
jgi:hypothetical protein